MIISILSVIIVVLALFFWAKNRECKALKKHYTSLMKDSVFELSEAKTTIEDLRLCNNQTDKSLIESNKQHNDLMIEYDNLKTKNERLKEHYEDLKEIIRKKTA